MLLLLTTLRTIPPSRWKKTASKANIKLSLSPKNEPPVLQMKSKKSLKRESISTNTNMAKADATHLTKTRTKPISTEISPQ